MSEHSNVRRSSMQHRRLPKAARRWRAVALAAATVVMVASSCTPPPPQPPQSGIQLVGSDSGSGWKYDYFLNYDAPCSESGFQSFLVATALGSDPSASAPLWTFLHGGGAGYYDSSGDPMPSATNKRQESPQQLKNKLVGGLVGQAKNSPTGYRFLAVSMCSHDTYAGFNTPDPNNDKPTTGLAHTMAAISWVQTHYPTDDVVLHGGSAGSVGTFHVGYWMQSHGQAPTAIVADSAVINKAWQEAQNSIGQFLPNGSLNECFRPPAAMSAIPARWAPLFQTDDDQGHLRLQSGQLTVPVMHVWSTNDSNQCGARLMSCTLPNGSVVTMGSTECNNAPIHDVISHLPAARHSVDFEVCVDKPGAGYPEDCDWHVPTQTDGTNSNVAPGDPAADYNRFVLDWVEARVAATP